MRLMIIFTLAVSLILPTQSMAKDVYVKGHFRSNGTYVAPHHRSSPDNNSRNNYGSSGNINPYSGNQGHTNSVGAYRRPNSAANDARTERYIAQLEKNQEMENAVRQQELELKMQAMQAGAEILANTDWSQLGQSLVSGVSYLTEGLIKLPLDILKAPLAMFTTPVHRNTHQQTTRPQKKFQKEKYDENTLKGRQTTSVESKSGKSLKEFFTDSKFLSLSERERHLAGENYLQQEYPETFKYTSKEYTYGFIDDMTKSLNDK